MHTTKFRHIFEHNLQRIKGAHKNTQTSLTQAMKSNTKIMKNNSKT